MEKLLVFLGLGVGGWIGWAVGAPFGMFAAFMLSIVGTALGLSTISERWAAWRPCPLPRSSPAF